MQNRNKPFRNTRVVVVLKRGSGSHIRVYIGTLLLFRIYQFLEATNINFQPLVKFCPANANHNFK